MEPITLSILAGKIGAVILTKLGIIGFTAKTATIVGGVVLAGGAGLIFISFLKMDEIVNWFTDPKIEIKARQKENIAFTLKTEIEEGNYAIVQGVFNKKAGSLEEGRVIKYDTLDSEMENAHRKHGLVIYPVD